MVGKRKDLKRFDECKHRQGMFFVRYQTQMKLVCRHCKKSWELETPAIMRGGGRAAAAKKKTGRQTQLPSPTSHTDSAYVQYVANT